MRIIASILVKGNGAYRTKEFKEDVYLGDPLNIAMLIEAMHYDEICFINKKRSHLPTVIDIEFIDLIKRVCRIVRIPISVVVDSASDLYVQMLFEQGIDRIYYKFPLNDVTDAIHWSQQFGKQSIGLTQSAIKLMGTQKLTIDTSYFCELRVYDRTYDNVKLRAPNIERYRNISEIYDLPLIISNGINKKNLEQFINLKFAVGLNVSSMTNSIGEHAAPFIRSNPCKR